MNSLLLDVQSALRFFSRRRAAFAVIVLTMALALGANTAVFAVMKAFVFANLAIPDSDRVVNVWTTKELPGRGAVNFNDAYPNFKLLRETTHSFASLATSLQTDVNWQQAEDTRRLRGMRVTADFFEVMRLQPAAGRFLHAREEGPGAAPVAVISHALWQSGFAGSPDVVGRTVRFNGEPVTIVGVAPPGFSQQPGTDVWMPFDLPANQWTAIVGARQLVTYARLAPGVTAAAANAELGAFTKRAREMDPLNREWGWTTQSLRANVLAGADRTLVVVQVGAGVLLVLAIANLASLLMAWAAERQRETAVRLALGASAWRLVRQFLTQSLALVSVGGVLGLLLAQLALPALQRLNPNPALAGFLDRLELDGGTMGFGAGQVLGMAFLAGLLPAWQSRSVAFTEALRSESRGASLGRGALRWQQAMVVVQTAVSVIILVAAALAGVGFRKLSQVPLGFDPAGRAVMQFQFPEPAYAAPGARGQFVRALEQALEREPALIRHAVGATIPVGDGQWGGAFYPQRAGGDFAPDPVVFHLRRSTPGYHAALGIPLLAGRMIDARDTADKPQVAVVSQALAEKYWPGENPLGKKLKRVSTAGGLPPIVEVVGVVGNVIDAGANAPVGETVYIPWEQQSMRRAWIVLQGRGSIEDTLAAGRRALRTVDPGVAAYNLNSLDTLAWQANALPRLQIVLLGVFAVMAVGITALGSYGVMSQLVANRRKELAIRAALGASRGGVLRLVLWQNARLAAGGVLIGLGLAWFGARAAQSQLTGFDASPVWPYLAVMTLVLTLTQLASLIPARRAARFDAQLALAGN